jgi:hypothetical protein
MHLLSNIGKILMTLAGLVAILDPIGERKLRHWTEAARRRRDHARDRSDNLAKARPWQAMVKRLTKLVTIHHVRMRPPYYRTRRPDLEERDKEYITTEEFEQFADDAWLTVKGKYRKAELDNPRFIFPAFEAMTYEFLIKRLPEPQSTWLTFAHREYRHRERRWSRIRLVLLTSVVPGAIALGLWFHAGGIQLWIAVIAAYLAAGMAGLTANALLLTPRFVTALLWAGAAVRLRLARAGLWALKDNGRWLRLSALAVFVAGSAMDLAGGWK